MPPRRFLTILLPAFAGALFVAIWIFVRASLSDDFRFLLPAPTEVLAAFRDHGDELWRATLNTAAGATLGFLAAVVVSFLLSLLLSLSPLVRVTFYPYLMLLQMTPIIVFAPILVLWVGAGLKSVTIITFLICFFPLAVNTTQGLVSTDRNLVELFQLYRATKFQEIRRLRIPAALPYFYRSAHRRDACTHRCPRRRLHRRQLRRRRRRPRFPNDHLQQPGEISRALRHRRGVLRARLYLCRRRAFAQLALPPQMA